MHLDQYPEQCVSVLVVHMLWTETVMLMSHVIAVLVVVYLGSAYVC